jgi:hypothetical protein
MFRVIKNHIDRLILKNDFLECGDIFMINVSVELIYAFNDYEFGRP